EITTSTVNELPLPVRTRDELGVLARSLNELSRQTKATISSFRNTQTVLAQAQAALRDSEAKFRAVVEGLGEGILLLDSADHILYVNSRMVEMTGYAEEELLGQHAFTLLLPSEPELQMQTHHRAREQGTAESYELELRRKDGARFWTMIHATP